MPISEYIIKQKNEGKALIKKLCALIGYALLSAVLIFLILALAPPLLYIPFMLVAAALVALTVFATWRFLCIEYEIIISKDELCASVIYGKTIVRRLVLLTVKDINEIGDYDDSAYERLCNMSLQKNTVCVSSLSAPVIYYALYDDGKDHCVIYFETDERGISILKQQNPTSFKIAKK